MKLKQLALLCCTFAAGVAFAQQDTSDVQRIKQLVKQKLDVQLQQVRKLPVGLYEIVYENHPYYVDKDVQFFFRGTLMEVDTQRDLTQERIEELRPRTDVSKLPKDQAIVTKRGNGKRVIYLFADPNCHYCKQLETTLSKMTDLTIYTFVTPLLGSEAETTDILCSKDPEKAWNDWILKDVKPAKSACGNKWGQKNLDLADKLNITSAPTIIFENGLMIDSALTQEQLESRFEKIYQPKKK